MAETFMDRRRNFLRDLIDQYGGDPADVEKYLEYWVKGRLQQVYIEMWIARDHGATSGELAEQFEYSSADNALGALNAAKTKVRKELGHDA